MEKLKVYRNNTPHSFDMSEFPFEDEDSYSPELGEGQRQGVHFTFASEQEEFLLEKLRTWFKEHDEIILVGHGTTEKKDMCFIILEWDGYEVNSLFLDILADDGRIVDYGLYTAK